MAFDKAKTLRAAEKYLELGKIPAAIKEYSKIAEHDSNDFTILNMLGDLHARVGANDQAIAIFTRIAEHYRKQEFGLKAIAMYKKIDRLRPHDNEIAHTLAKLYAEQDLVVEARAHYLLVADAYTRANQTQKALEVIRQIADLDSQNVEIRIKLADAYLKEGMKHEAIASFNQAGERLLAVGAFDRALETYGKSLEIDPLHLGALRGLLATHSARGTPDDAAEIIEQASACSPDNSELLSMLADTYLEASEATEAERVVTALVAKDSFTYLRFVEVAKLYLREDLLNDAVRIVDQVADRMLAGREDAQLVELINEVLAVDSDNVQSLRLLVRVRWIQRDRNELVASLERLAEAAAAAGLEDDERYALTQLTRLVQGEERHAARLNELGGSSEEAAAEILPTFENESSPSAETIEFTQSDFTKMSESQPATQAGASSDFEWRLSEEVPFEKGPVASATPPEFEIGFEMSPAVVVVDEQTPERVAVNDSHIAALVHELESVDFYLEQGYLDIAIDTLDLLENQFGAHADIESRRQRIKAQQGTGTDGSTPAAALVDQSAFAEIDFATPIEELPVGAEAVILPESGSNGQAHAAPIDAGLAEVFEEFRLSEEAEAGPNGDYETHYNLGVAYKEMDLLEEAVEEFQTAVKIVSPNDGTSRYLQCCNLLGHCFLQKGVPRLAAAWFDKGLSAPGHSAEEYQALLFDLGSAYEEMGELDRALEIFTEIYGTNISYRGVKEKLHELQARVECHQPLTN
jgi:tetratricopeptide (TPR) repeat protein